MTVKFMFTFSLQTGDIHSS